MAKHAVKSDKLIAHLINIHLLEDNLSWEQLATNLELSQDQIAKLALCNRPRSNNHVQDILRIASYIGTESNQLGQFITQLETSIKFQDHGDDQYLTAARDLDDEDN